MNPKTTTLSSLIVCMAAARVFAQADASKTPEKAEEPKKPKWESSVGAGLAYTAGNSETLTATANALTAKKWEKNELSFGATFTYGENDGVKSANSVSGFGQYNRLFTDRVYGYANVGALYDEIAEVDYRVGLSLGAGYYFIKNDKTTLSAEVGPGYVWEKVGGDPNDYVTLRVAQKFEIKLTPTTRLWEGIEYVPQVDRFENYVVTAEAGIETSISKAMNLRVYAQDIYRSEPAPGREHNDFKLICGVQYKF